MEALAGAGKQDQVRELLKQVLNFDHSDETIAMLHEHLERAGHADLLAKPETIASESGTTDKGGK